METMQTPLFRLPAEAEVRVNGPFEFNAPTTLWFQTGTLDVLCENPKMRKLD